MNILKAAATVSGMNLLSRITGLVRETLTATLFGASAMTDAYIVAFRLPNLLRRMFAEGAFSQSFVPILAETREAGDIVARGLIDRVATALFWTVLGITILAIVGAPLLVWLMATGLESDPAAFDASILMTRLMFPYILFMSMTALSAGVLNTWRHFAVPAFTPVLLNVSVILVAVVFSRHFDPPIYALVAGVLIGGVAQLAIQVPALHRLGLLPRLSFNMVAAYRDPKTRELLRLMAPAVLAVSVSQISLVVNTNIASRLAHGSVSWVTYSDRLMEFPTALLGVALGTVLLPSLSRAGVTGRTEDYSALLDWGLRLCVVLTVPCMVGLGLMALPLTAMLFHYGRFDSTDVVMTSRAVAGYSIGLIGLIAVKVLAPGYYARKDVRTPVKIGILTLALTQGFNYLLVPVFAHAGLTLSISLAALVNSGLLLIGLRRRGAYRPHPGWWPFIAKITGAALAMALALAWAVPRFDWVAMHDEPLRRIAYGFALVLGAGAIYLGALMATGIRPAHFLRHTTH